eukprot:6495137-Prymnesium_polylepis.1
MQGGGGLRRAAPCASRVGMGRARVAGGPGWRFGRGAAESRAAWDRGLVSQEWAGVTGEAHGRREGGAGQA